MEKTGRPLGRSANFACTSRGPHDTPRTSAAATGREMTGWVQSPRTVTQQPDFLALGDANEAHAQAVQRPRPVRRSQSCPRLGARQGVERSLPTVAAALASHGFVRDDAEYAALRESTRSSTSENSVGASQNASFNAKRRARALGATQRSFTGSFSLHSSAEHGRAHSVRGGDAPNQAKSPARLRRHLTDHLWSRIRRSSWLHPGVNKVVPFSPPPCTSLSSSASTAASPALLSAWRFRSVRSFGEEGAWRGRGLRLRRTV